MTTFIQIQTKKFPILDGEEDELLNDGMYGKACGQYIQQNLTKLGYDCSQPICEDWGWGVAVESQGVRAMVCIYAAAAQKDPQEYACTIDGGSRVWSWRKFRFVNSVELEQWTQQVNTDLQKIFVDDPDIKVMDGANEFAD